MKPKLLENITPPFLKLYAGFKIKERVIDISEVMEKARSLLVLMPMAPEEFRIAQGYLDELQNNFPKARFTLVMEDQYGKLRKDSNHYGTIFVTSNDVNILGLPKKDLIRKITASTYDIAIDLNHNFHLLSTYLCQKSAAQLRVCLTHKSRDPFYNFHFRSPEEDGLLKRYQNLFKYLSARS